MTVPTDFHSLSKVHVIMGIETVPFPVIHLLPLNVRYASSFVCHNSPLIIIITIIMVPLGHKGPNSTATLPRDES
jgi:hypothetical protein